MNEKSSEAGKQNKHEWRSHIMPTRQDITLETIYKKVAKIEREVAQIKKILLKNLRCVMILLCGCEILILKTQSQLKTLVKDTD